MYQCNFSNFGLPAHETHLNNGVSISNLESLEVFIHETFGVSKDGYYILCNGKKIDFLQQELGSNFACKVLNIIPRTFGGKGGFGSMLRAIGAQIEKTTNREACRDLSGRRLRDINEEQRLKNWIAQQADREKEVSENRKKRLERLCQEPKHEFKDDKYNESRSAMSEEINSAIDKGISAVNTRDKCSVGLKRKSNDESGPSSKSRPATKKKKKLWIDAEDSDSSEATSGNESEGQASREVKTN